MSSCTKRKRDPEKTDIREFFEILVVLLFIICMVFLEPIFWIGDKTKALFQRGIKEEKVS